MIKFSGLFASKKQALAVSALLLALICLIDYITADEISFSAFYLIPIGLATWRAGSAWGMTFAVTSGIIWFHMDYVLVERYYRHPLIPYWNALLVTVFFVLISHLLAKISSTLKKEREASEMKSKLIHMVSHEFNNALTSLVGSSFLLRETDTSGDPMRTKLYETTESTQRMLKMFVKNILNSARIDAGKLRIKPETFALRELVAECLESHETQIAQKGLTLEKLLPTVPLLVSADRELLMLSISNLIGNALKYTPAGGKIIISVSPETGDGGKVAFSVENTGSGLNREELARVFDTFYRTENGKASAEGFGLGLKFSQEILQAHGSRLNVVSQQGKSVKFSFLLDGAPAPCLNSLS